MFKADGGPGGGHRTVEASERMMRKGIVLISEKMPQGYLFVVVTVLLGRVCSNSQSKSMFLIQHATNLYNCSGLVRSHSKLLIYILTRCGP